MKKINATHARAHWAETLEHAAREPVIITRRAGADMALITRAQLEAFQALALDEGITQVIDRHHKSLKALAAK